MDGPGTITWEEFIKSAEDIVKLSNKISDHWQIVGNKEIPGQAYLARQEKIFVPVDYLADEPERGNRDECDDRRDEEWSEKLDTSTDPYEAFCAKERPLIIEHHILWSMSYSVPVIYFNGWRSDFPGINAVSAESAQRLLADAKLAYSELSQAIHPISGRPYLQLHPCGSRLLMLNAPNSANKLVSWLSAIAPAALNFRLRQEYYHLTIKSGEKFKGDTDCD
ncbi:hypothetical protein QAD02_006916 [Eretmocerus hayati]|uniref:Uncharacterized protein n=1 Tax=Eretmocerus hayati TaxID=131215 RepID=A0ACC2N4L1_9HYME|nr:hypothetical protein QAD02_006916 [Eretmocerus hayati]